MSIRLAMSFISRYCKELVVKFGIVHPLALVPVLILAPILLITQDRRSVQMRLAARH